MLVLLVSTLALASCEDAKDSPFIYPREWSAAQKIPGSSSNSQWPRIATDSNNIAHIAWMDCDTYDVCYTNSVNWGTVTNISNSGPEGCPDIAVDSNNIVHIAWEEPGVSWYENFVFIANATDWAATKTIISNPTEYSSTPVIAVDSDGVVHAAWIETVWLTYYVSDTQTLIYANSTDWAGTRVALPGSTYTQDMSIAVDSNGVVHIAWREYNRIRYANSTNWFWTMEKVADMPDISTSPTLLVDKSNVAHVFWVQWLPDYSFEIYYANSIDWPTTLTGTGIKTYIGMNAAIGPRDAIHVVWSKDTGGDADIFYANLLNPGLTKSNASNTTDRPEWSSMWPAIAVDSSGAVHVVWEERNGSECEVFYCHSER